MTDREFYDWPPPGEGPNDANNADDPVSGYTRHTDVRGDLFKPSGKWGYTVHLDYSDTAAIVSPNGYIDPNLAARHALRTATARGTSEVSFGELDDYWTLVVIHPPNGWPVLVRQLDFGTLLFGDRK